MGHDVTLFATGDSDDLGRAGRRCASRPQRFAPNFEKQQRALRAPAGAGAPRGARVRRAALPHRLPPVLAVHPPADAVPEHAARPARPATGCRHLRPVPRGAAGLDLRRAARADAASQLGGDGPARHAAQPADAAAGAASATTSPSSAASRPRRASSPRSASPPRPGAKLQGRRQDRRGGLQYYRERRSRRCSAASVSSSWARSTTRRSRRSSPAPARCCSRSTGRSRSAW